MYAALICHLIGDFALQNDWMASKKRTNSFVCGVHVAVYTSVFLFVTWSLAALAFIAGTHFLIDRFGLARRWVGFYGVGGPWDKDVMTPIPEPQFKNFWLLVVVDQAFHLVCNQLALLFLT